MGERITEEDLALAKLVGHALFNEVMTDIGRSCVRRLLEQLHLCQLLRAYEKALMLAELLGLTTEQCPVCNGHGSYTVIESGHDPNCDGTCAIGCPVPIEALEECSACNGTGEMEVRRG